MSEPTIEKYTRQIKQIIDRNPDEYFLQKLLMKAASWERVFHKKPKQQNEDVA